MLLSHWVSLAQSAAAWSNGVHGGKDGEKAQASVPDLIVLQAVWFSLSRLSEWCDPAERSLGLDRAAWLIENHRTHLQRIWSDQAMPDGIRELIDDAQGMWRQAKSLEEADDVVPGWQGVEGGEGVEGGNVAR